MSNFEENKSVIDPTTVPKLDELTFTWPGTVLEPVADTSAEHYQTTEQPIWQDTASDTFTPTSTSVKPEVAAAEVEYLGVPVAPSTDIYLSRHSKELTRELSEEEMLDSMGDWLGGRKVNREAVEQRLHEEVHANVMARRQRQAEITEEEGVEAYFGEVLERGSEALRVVENDKREAEEKLNQARVLLQQAIEEEVASDETAKYFTHRLTELNNQQTEIKSKRDGYIEEAEKLKRDAEKLRQLIDHAPKRIRELATEKTSTGKPIDICDVDTPDGVRVNLNDHDEVLADGSGVTDAEREVFKIPDDMNYKKQKELNPDTWFNPRYERDWIISNYQLNIPHWEAQLAEIESTRLPELEDVILPDFNKQIRDKNVEIQQIMASLRGLDFEHDERVSRLRRDYERATQRFQQVLAKEADIREKIGYAHDQRTRMQPLNDEPIQITALRGLYGGRWQEALTMTLEERTDRLPLAEEIKAASLPPAAAPKRLEQVSADSGTSRGLNLRQVAVEGVRRLLPIANRNPLVKEIVTFRADRVDD